MESTFAQSELERYQKLYYSEEHRRVSTEAQMKALITELEHMKPAIVTQRKNYEQLIDAYDDLKASAIDLQESDQQSQTQIASLQKSLKEEQNKNSSLVAENQDLKSEVEKLRTKVKKQDDELENPFLCLKNKEEVERRNSDLEKILQANFALKVDLKGERDKIARLENRIQELKNPISSLIGYKVDINHPDTNELFVLHTKLTSELDSLRQRFEQADLENSQLKQSLSASHNEAQTLRENSNLTSIRLESAIKEKAASDLRLQSLLIQEQMKERVVKDKTEKVTQLTNELQKARSVQTEALLKEQADNFQARKEQHQQLTEEFGVERRNLQAQVEELQSRLAHNSLSSELLTVKTMYEHLQGQYSVMFTQQEGLKAQWERDISAVVEKAKEYKDISDELELRIIASESMALEDEISQKLLQKQLQNRVDELLAQVYELNQNNQTTTKQLQALQTEKMSAAMTEQFASITRAQKEQEMAAKVTKAEEQATQLQNQLATANSALEEIKNNLENEKQTSAQLQSQLSQQIADSTTNAEANTETQSEQQADFERRLQEAKETHSGEIQALTAQHQEANEALIQSYTQRIDFSMTEHEKEVTSIQSQLSMMEDLEVEFAEEKADLLQQLEDAQQEFAKEKADSQQKLESAKQQYAKENADLLQQLEEAQLQQPPSHIAINRLLAVLHKTCNKTN